MRREPEDTAPRKFGVVHEAPDPKPGWEAVAGGYKRQVILDADERDDDGS